MKKLIVTTAVAITIATSGYVYHERQVEQLQYKYEQQLNQNSRQMNKIKNENKDLQVNIKTLSNSNDDLEKKISRIELENYNKSNQIQRQSDEITKLKKQIDESPSWLTFRASAYTTHANGDAYVSGKYGNKTASGSTVKQGRTIAVDRNLIPLGTKLEVKFPEPYNYLNGVYTAEDTGNGIKGYEVDLYLNNHSDCINFGVKKIQIKIL